MWACDLEIGRAGESARGAGAGLRLDRQVVDPSTTVIEVRHAITSNDARGIRQRGFAVPLVGRWRRWG